MWEVTTLKKQKDTHVADLPAIPERLLTGSSWLLEVPAALLTPPRQCRRVTSDLTMLAAALTCRQGSQEGARSLGVINKNPVLRTSLTFPLLSVPQGRASLALLLFASQVEEALTIKNTDIAKELCLPPVKLHCSSESALQNAHEPGQSGGTL